MRLGVFDSGVGGLTVLRALQAAWPGHSTVYVGDTARVPYGSKSPETIIRYARQIAQLLLEHRVELIVVACNTASAYAIEALRSELPLPVVGVIEPGAAAAAAATQTGRIAVIGTAATIASGAYEAAIRVRRPEAQIQARACPLFVPLAEEGWEGTDVARRVAETYLEAWLPGRSERPDTLVLGCTHYPLLKEALGEVMGPEVALIDSAEATAEALRPHLAGAAREDAPAHRLFVTDSAPGFATAARRLLGREAVELELIDLTPLAAR